MLSLDTILIHMHVIMLLASFLTLWIVLTNFGGGVLPFINIGAQTT